MADRKRVYWDACVWIALIAREATRFDRCLNIIEQARRGDLEIWTSAFTLAEVFKHKCGGGNGSLATDSDADFEDYLRHSFVVEVQVDRDVGVRARRLLRAHPPLKKPTDAIHLATAVEYDVEEFHTFDEENLIALNGAVATKSGTAMKICFPPERQPDLIDQMQASVEAPAETAAVSAAANSHEVEAPTAESGPQLPTQDAVHDALTTESNAATTADAVEQVPALAPLPSVNAGSANGHVSPPQSAGADEGRGSGAGAAATELPGKFAG